ncbi:MAG: DNA polymerase III subunit [Deferribacterales bacterium]|nr:DNA polymerase III subunit [Deferribacterales bacterium]
MKVIGFDREKDIFSKITQKKQFANAYIFSGIEGCGKFLFAKNLAKSILCQKGSFFSQCDCQDCSLADNNSHPDIFILNIGEIDSKLSHSKKDEAQSKDSIGIDEIKELREIAFLSPYRGMYKFFLINDAHKMTHQAANAFLKTLEEPPENTIFILITHLPEKLLPTIQSRCLNFEFSRLNDNYIKQILSEKFSDTSSETLEEACKYACGSVKKGIEHLSMKVNKIVKTDIYEDLDNILDYIFRVNDKDGLKIIVDQLYINLIEKYRKEQNNKYLTISNYLLNMLSMLQSNFNLNIAKTDLIIKLYGEFSGKS